MVGGGSSYDDYDGIDEPEYASLFMHRNQSEAT
jgi:hypothetical protein